MRYLSVCSGIEAATVAWHGLGWTPVGFSEIEPFPSAVLAHHYPNVPNFGDMTKHEQWPLQPGSIDLLVGGTPCQSYSVAGLRQGLADPRGSLMLTYLAIAARLRPKYLVWENVPGVLSSNGGRDFGTFLGALGELGYGWCYRCLDAQYVRVGRWPRAVPQRRRRVFVVGCLGDGTAAAEVLALREGLQRHLEAGGKARKGAAADAEGGVGAGCWWDGGQVSQTLDAVLSKGQTMPEKNRFPAVLQPVAHAFYSTGGTHGVNQHPEVSPAVKVGSGLGIPSPPAVVIGTDCYNGPITGDVAATMGTPGSSVNASGPTVMQAMAFDWQKGNDIHNPRPSTMNVQHECTPTIGTTRTPAVAHALRADGFDASEDGTGRGTPLVPVAPSLTATNDPSRSPQSSEVTQQVAAVYASTMTVRRLTPRECERLQGFPDDWTLIPWRKKQAEDCPDGPRYRALGNSMACNCMAWIGERIAKWEAEHER